MQKCRLSFALALVALLCGCNKQTEVNTRKIDVLTQKMFILQQAQSKQLSIIQSQLASLPALQDKTDRRYYQALADKALFYHTNDLYFMLLMDQRIQSQFQTVTKDRKESDALAYYYHTNQTDAVYYCAGQIAKAVNTQEKNLAASLAKLQTQIAANTRQLEAQMAAATTATRNQMSDQVSNQLSRQLKPLAPQITVVAAQTRKLAAKQQELEARLTQIQRDLAFIKARLQATATSNSPAGLP